MHARREHIYCLINYNIRWRLQLLYTDRILLYSLLRLLKERPVISANEFSKSQTK